jgi:hypothetical protein
MLEMLLGPMSALATMEGDGVPNAVTDTEPNLVSSSDIDPKSVRERRSGGLKLKKASPAT